jgi:AraC family transcriptional regulator of adaptative response / DNA-3-methyladenine glycosylase II
LLTPIAESFSLRLPFTPPFDWAGVLAYLRPRAMPGVEWVEDHPDGRRYWRSVTIERFRGVVCVDSRGPGSTVLNAVGSLSLLPARELLLARLRRMFDLDLNPAVVCAHLGRDRRLAALIGRRPGLRVAGSMHRFELALRAVLGQQVTVRGASTLAGRLVQLVARPRSDSAGGPVTHWPISASRLADTRIGALRRIGLPASRARTLVALARATVSGRLPELSSEAPCPDPTDFVNRLTEVPGIGPWTAQYVCMRALGMADAFPDSDLGLRKAMGGLSPARLRAEAERWRPFRAYAAQHLWASLAIDD